MIGMKLIRYQHTVVPPIVVLWYRILHEWIGRLLISGGRRPHLTPGRRRFLLIAGVLVSLVSQLVMLMVLAELVELCISLMEVWAELAAKHLEITLDRSS